MSKKKKVKSSEVKPSVTRRSTTSMSIRTITDKTNRFMVGIKPDSRQGVMQIILLKPPCVKSVLDSLPPEEILAMQKFVERVIDALGEQGFRVTPEWRV